MKKLILFEGPDCSGKTTLINALKWGKDRYIHNGLYDTQEDALRAYIDQINEFDRSTEDCFTFLDRAHWSEHIYGKVVRNKPMLMGDFNHIEDMLNEANAIVILCLPPYELAVDRWGERNTNNEEFIKHVAKYSEIYNGYESIQKITSSNIIEYDYSNPFNALTALISELR